VVLSAAPESGLPTTCASGPHAPPTTTQTRMPRWTQKEAGAQFHTLERFRAALAEPQWVGRTKWPQRAKRAATSAIEIVACGPTGLGSRRDHGAQRDGVPTAFVASARDEIAPWDKICLGA